MCDPKGCATILGVVGGGGGRGDPPHPLVDPNLGGRRVGRSAPGSRGGGGGGAVGTPTYAPQNDPHDTLIILNIHNWGKQFFSKKLPINSGSHQPRSDPEVRSGSKSFFVFFIHF